MAKCDWCASKRDDGMCLIERDVMLEAERRIDEIESYKQRAEKAESERDDLIQERDSLMRRNLIYNENIKNQNDGVDIVAAYEDRLRTAEAVIKAQQMRIDEQERMLADYEAIKADRDALVKEIEDYNAKQAKVPTSPRPKTAQEGLRFLAKWFDAKYEDSGTGTDTVQQDLRRWSDDIDTKELRIKSAANLITNVAQILNVVQSEWGAEGQWSEWDQGVRDSITAWLSEYHGKSLPCSEPEPQTVHTDPPPYHPYPGTGVDR